MSVVNVGEVRMHMDPDTPEHSQTNAHHPVHAAAASAAAARTRPHTPPSSNNHNGNGNGADQQQRSKESPTPPVPSKNQAPAAAGGAAEEGRLARWTRRWKHSKLYEFISTGHEDACAFECSSIEGPQGGYWPELYPAEALARSWSLRMHRRWTFFVRPWIRMICLVILVLYWFALMNSFATWRTNAMADKHGYNPPMGLNPRYSSADQLPADKVFILDDILHLLIPAVGGDEYLAWKRWVDYSLVVAMVIAAVTRVITRDLMRLGEWAAAEIVIFAINGLIHVLTAYPDPWGSNGSCQKTDHRTYGKWIYTNFNFDYCGDQMFSGHTFNWIVGIIMIRRVLYEFIGWDFLPLQTLTHSTASYIRSHDLVTGLMDQAAGGKKALADALKSAGFGRGSPTRNVAVLTKHLDETSLPGFDPASEALEATRPVPLGSATPMPLALARAEGLGYPRARQLAVALRMPVHVQAGAAAGGEQGHGGSSKEELEMQLYHTASSHPHPHPASNAHATRQADGGHGGKHASSASSSSSHHQQHLAPVSGAQLWRDGEALSIAGRVVEVHAEAPQQSFFHGTTLPPEVLPTAPFQLTAPIPASFGGLRVGGHYGSKEGHVNTSRIWDDRQQGHSELPAPEDDDARGHGMNAFYRYRVNAPVSERIVMSRAPPPYFVRAHPRASWWALNILRVILVAYTGAFIAGVIKIRYHYGADVFVSITVSSLVATNEKILQGLLKFIYRPVDSRFKDAPMYPFSMHPQHFQDTLSKVGVGGLI